VADVMLDTGISPIAVNIVLTPSNFEVAVNGIIYFIKN
jgi:hypothetical protein